jgi:hypothetical protein
MSIRTIRVVGLAASLALTPVSAWAQDPASQAARMERMKEIYQPSAPHRELAKLAGTWQQEVRLASGKPEPLVLRGRVTNRVVLDGRFVASEGTARAEAGGMAYDSMLMFGFDGRSREYTAIVLDTFGTYFVTAAGAASPGASAITMKGQTPEGGSIKHFDVVLTWIDANTYRTEIIFKFPGREPDVAVSTTYRRVS